MIKNYTFLPVKALYNECSMLQYEALLGSDALMDEYTRLDASTRLLDGLNLQPSDELLSATLDRCFSMSGVAMG